jgi:sulfoxide reductase catalytic subunit YedY
LPVIDGRRSHAIPAEDVTMHVIHRPSWALPESAATPEHLFMNRRAVIGAGVAMAASLVAPQIARAAQDADRSDPTSDLYPMKRNEAYQLDRPITDEKINGTYNNFYEFGSSKMIAKPAQALNVRPWTVKIDGMVEQPREIGVDDLIRSMPLEERLYRHRCVEAWSMAIPWSGFPFAALVKFAKPLSSAKYVRMETFFDAKVASGQRQTYLPWPYVEGLTLAEATNELAFVAVGAYGKPMPKVHGAPLRIAIPWKYGFKSIKSIVRFTFTDQRPKSFWEALASSEYGFWANVNPKVPHPRWSQETEELIGLKERRPTMLFNGYGEQVASLYVGLEKERLYA